MPTVSKHYIKSKKEYKIEKGDRPKPFQKVLNLQLGISNLLLMYSPLIKSGILSDQNNSKEGKKKKKAKVCKTLSARITFPVDMGHYKSHVS